MASTNSTVDGLGNEELNQAGSQVASMWLTGSATVDTHVKTPTLVGTTIVSGANSSVAGSVTVAAGKVLPYAFAVGSPSTNAQYVWQGGSAAAGAGSNVWVSYPTAFSAAPRAITATCLDGPGDIAIGSEQAGSFYVETETASRKFRWMALGPA